VRRRPLVLSGLALVAAMCFGVLAVLVTRQSGLIARFDLAMHQSLRTYGLTHPTWLMAMRAITHLGDTAAIAAFDATALAVCLWRGRRSTAMFVAVVGIGVWSSRLLVRALVGRARPVDALWPADGLSFPSGHTANFAATAAIVVVVCWPLFHRAGRIALVTAAVIGALLVGVSRIAGGVHWPSDVVGGLLLAGALVRAAGAIFLVTAPDGPGDSRAQGVVPIR
jgi:membrane-associated phospholipid phosphatase